MAFKYRAANTFMISTIFIQYVDILSNDLIYCSYYAEASISVNIEIPHSSSSSEITITTNLDSPPENESWGIRDLYIFI
jgi:hypothetical protein